MAPALASTTERPTEHRSAGDTDAVPCLADPTCTVDPASDRAPRDRTGRVSRTLSNPWTLPVLCVGLVVAEASLLAAAQAGESLALAPQVAALAPWGVFHDLRWLFVYASSWPLAIIGFVALVLVRAAITAVMVRAAWPSSVPFSWRTTGVRALTSTAVAAVLLSPCASLLVAFSLAPISDIWLAAIPTALGVALMVHHGPVVCWWLRHPRLRSLGWLMLSYVELTVAGALLVAAPAGVRPLVVVAAGLFDAVAWRGLVGALAVPHYRLRLAPVAPAGLAALIGVTVVSVTAASAPPASGAVRHATASHTGAARSGGPAASPQHTQPQAQQPATATPTASHPPAQPVLAVSGYDVSWRGVSLGFGPGFTVRQFSYRGTKPNGDPLTYTSSYTQAALPVLLAKFRAQVAELAAKTGRPIDIVGESEGALLATVYLLTTPHPPVRNVVLMSPLVRPARASYPGVGEAGPGVAAAWELRGVAKVTTALTPLRVSADSNFINSLAGHTTALRDAYSCPVAGVRQFSIVPLADAVGVPYGTLQGVPHRVVLALHGTLLMNSSLRSEVGQYLTTGKPGSLGSLGLEKLLQAGSAAWQAPARPLQAAVPDSVDCNTTKAELIAWLGQG